MGIFFMLTQKKYFEHADTLHICVVMQNNGSGSGVACRWNYLSRCLLALVRAAGIVVARCGT